MMTDQPIVEEKQTEKRRSHWAGIGVFFSILALAILVCVFWYANFQLTQIVATLDKGYRDNQTAVTSLQKNVADLQAEAQKSQALSSQQEQVLAEWRAVQKGDLDKWHVAEAQYLVKLADDHLQFSHDAIMVTTLLQQADQVLQNLQDSNVLDLRKSIATDLASLQASPIVNVTDLYLQLSAINNQVDKLPLPANPIQSDKDQAVSAPISSDLPWWKKGWAYSMQALHKIVIVRYNGANALPLVLPEEKTFLYQNLHAQLESAMWSVQHRNAQIYLASLDRTSAWVRQYFVQDANETKAFLQSIEELRKVDIQPPAANLNNTLQLFNTYLTQAGQVKAG